MGMYDKMGDLLNEYLETGNLPPPRRKVARKKSVKAAVSPREKMPVPAYLAREFGLLGFADVQEAPALKDCRKAYHALIKKYHPDTKKQDGDTAEKADEIVQAFKRIQSWYSGKIQ
jgi:hypothetical protein